MSRVHLLLLPVLLWFCVTLPAGAATADCPPGTLRCGATSCCSGAQTCSWDGYCIPLGATYCGGGRSCGPFEQCVAGGTRCAPKGDGSCQSGLTCGPGMTCTASGRCVPITTRELEIPINTPCKDGRVCPAGTQCLPEGGCSRVGWFLCEETGSQCRPGFKCSAERGCVPLKAVDCGQGKWCKPGEICLPEGGCAPAD
ncbi:scavenger receptor class F, member 2 [Ruegeria pomeroyi]|nr:scavenger receptor class F, member 2 [Ruegeria pomeroyi]